MDHPKYSLHLFAGAGGGLLADIIGGETVPVCAVEIEKHPQRVLAKRFPDLAIWDDVLGDLAALRYDAAWGIVSAADMGALHLRERFWLTARRNDTDPDLRGA